MVSEAQKRGLANVRTTYAKAEALPFEDGTFDLVTCRRAHHFDSICMRIPQAAGRCRAPPGSVGD